MIIIRGGNRLHSQLPSECDYSQSTRIYSDYQLIIAINSSTLYITALARQLTVPYQLLEHQTCKDWSQKRGQQGGDMVAVIINSISEKWNLNARRVYCIEAVRG